MNINPLEDIPVARVHLEEIYRALNACQGYHAAFDLSEGFRTLAPNSKPSRLTALIIRSIDRLDEYMIEEEEDD